MHPVFPQEERHDLAQRRCVLFIMLTVLSFCYPPGREPPGGNLRGCVNE
jgi:hypothetical protein